MTDRAVVKLYSDAMADGSVFPPVLVYRTTDGDLLLTDGFHRVEARRALGFRNVRAVIRDGTLEDAILAGINANLVMLNTNRPTDDDRQHAAKVMLRNETFRGWSDRGIGMACGLSGGTVTRIRLCLTTDEGVALPERVMDVKDGRPTGKTHRYRQNKTGVLGTPAKTTNSRGVITVGVGGKTVSLGRDPAAADSRLASLVSAARDANNRLRRSSSFRDWLMHRSLDARALDFASAISCSGALLVPVPDADHDAVLRGVGVAALARHKFAHAGRVILVGYFGSLGTQASESLALASQVGIESMSPEELVAALGGTPGPAEGDDVQDAD
jgi:hypothetical protein